MQSHVGKAANAANTLVCIHGPGGGAWEWNIWRRVFAAQGWQVVAVQLQPVTAGVAATRYDDYCAQVASCCASLTLARPVIAGASLGGLLAMQQAAAQRPAGLILVNPLPTAGIRPGLPHLPASPAVINWSRSRLASTMRALPDADSAAVWYAWRRWRDESGQVVDAARSGIVVEPPNCPSLLFASANDADIPPQCTRSLARALEGTCIDVEDAGHLGPLMGNSAVVCASRALSWAQQILGAAP